MTAPPVAMRLLWGAAILGLMGAGLGWITTPRIFYGAWLAAFCVLAALPLGSLALLLVHAMTGGRWGELLEPSLLRGLSLMPLLLPAAIPLLFGLSQLYPWLSPNLVAPLPNRFYLNGPFFAGRASLYAIVWLGLWRAVLHAAHLPNKERVLARLAPIGAILLAVTVTFAMIDLGLSLEPRFNSSIWGLLSGVGMALFALSAAIVAATLTGPFEGDVGTDLGRILLGLTLLWAYLEFMQGLIVWESDLPRDIPWYLKRTSGAWGGVAWLLVIGHFVLPFLLLLAGRVRRHQGAVAVIAATLIVMEIIRWWWVLLPALSLALNWIDVAAMLGLGGLAAGIYLRIPRPAGDRPAASIAPLEERGHG